MLGPLVLDAIALGLIILCLVKGYREGFLQTMISFAGYLIALALSSMVAKWLSGGIASLFRESIYASTLETVEHHAVDAAGTAFSQIIDSLPSIISSWVGLLDPAGAVQKNAEQAAAAGTNQLAEVVTDTIVMPAVAGIVQMVLVALLFFLMLFVVRKIAKVTNIVNHIPIVGGLNRLGGAVIGGLKGVVIAIVFLLLAGVFLSITGGGIDILKNTTLLSMLFRFTPF